ncbi:MAG: hypothetical protein U1E46_18600 [Hyphomicrobiales bacterium]
MATLLVSANAVAALDFANPQTLPLAPTVSEWTQILQEAHRRSSEPKVNVQECPGAAFSSTAERQAAFDDAAGDGIVAYAQLCREVHVQTRLKIQRLNRSRCCGG